MKSYKLFKEETLNEAKVYTAKDYKNGVITVGKHTFTKAKDPDKDVGKIAVGGKVVAEYVYDYEGSGKFVLYQKGKGDQMYSELNDLIVAAQKKFK